MKVKNQNNNNSCLIHRKSGSRVWEHLLCGIFFWKHRKTAQTSFTDRKVYKRDSFDQLNVGKLRQRRQIPDIYLPRLQVFTTLLSLSIEHQNVIIVVYRDSFLADWFQLLSKSNTASQMYDEYSFLRNHELHKLCMKLLSITNQFNFKLENSLTMGINY